MSLNERVVTISILARQCLISFEKCLRGTSALDTRRYSAIEDQMARFSIWTSNMAVFGKGKACMDHRVREVPEVQRLILGILEILHGRIEECIHLVERLTTPQISIEMQFSILALGNFERNASAISSQVDLLHGLSNTIRKASKESQNIKAIASFQMKDEEGNVIEDILRSYFLSNLQDRFPESTDSIRKRLADTMILRRKRILYRRSRYAINPIKPSEPASKPPIQTQSVPQHREPQPQELNALEVTNSPVTPSQIYSAVQSATTLVPQNFQRASAPSVISHANSVDLGSHEDLVFPPRPGDPNRSVIEVTCPYCLYVLSSCETSNEARWRRHVLGDLDALVCLFDPCDEPDVLYKHTKDWHQHMRKHIQRWRCSAKTHSIQDYENREEFENHMREGHGKHYTSAQLDLLAEKAMRSSGLLFEICPLCGGEGGAECDAVSGNLMDHIVGHLRTLALKSLPPYYGDGGDTASNASDGESARSHSTVKIALDNDSTPLDFSDNESRQRDDNLYGDWGYVLVTISKSFENEYDPIKESIARARMASMPDTVTSSPNTEPDTHSDDENFEEDEVKIPLNRVKLETEDGWIESLAPSVEGFRQYILKINPDVPKDNHALVDRIALQMMTRFETLQRAKIRHLELPRGKCDSGPLCSFKGGLGTGRRLEPFFGQPTKFGPEFDTENFPLGFPLPPTASFPAEFECQLCYRPKQFRELRDWLTHVHEDLQPFTCSWVECRDPKTFERRTDWVHHEHQAHHYIEWWTCDKKDCHSIHYSKDTFVEHLVHELESKDNGGKITEERIEKCHIKTQKLAQDEPCSFCGRIFPTWEKLTHHLGKHMEHINMPIIELINKIGTYRHATLVPESSLAPQGISPAQVPMKRESTIQSGSYRTGRPDPPSVVPILNFGYITELDEKGRKLLHYFLEFVLPIIYPILRITRHEDYVSELVLPSLQNNKSYLHCCLMMAAQHRKYTMNTQSTDTGESTNIEIMQHREVVTGTMLKSLSQDKTYESTLDTALGVILSQCWVGSDDTSLFNLQWSSHLDGVYSLVKALDYPSRVSDPVQQIPFNMSLTAWIDILRATLVGRKPTFASTYRAKSLSESNNSLGLRELMGCNDRVMYIISDIACLEASNRGGLYLSDDYLNVDSLNGQLDQTGEMELKPPFDAKGSLIPWRLTRNITRAFNLAARIYLYSLDPDFSPTRPRCVELVEAVMSTLQYIPSGPTGFDRSLVWVYLIAGSASLASSGFREIFDGRAAQLGRAANFGSFGRVVSVLREVWRQTDLDAGSKMASTETPRVFWRHVMEQRGWNYLLI